MRDVLSMMLPVLCDKLAILSTITVTMDLLPTITLTLPVRFVIQTSFVHRMIRLRRSKEIAEHFEQVIPEDW